MINVNKKKNTFTLKLILPETHMKYFSAGFASTGQFTNTKNVCNFFYVLFKTNNKKLEEHE